LSIRQIEVDGIYLKAGNKTSYIMIKDIIDYDS